jgi:hypothetical protein
MLVQMYAVSIMGMTMHYRLVNDTDYYFVNINVLDSALNLTLVFIRRWEIQTQLSRNVLP